MDDIESILINMFLLVVGFTIYKIKTSFVKDHSIVVKYSETLLSAKLNKYLFYFSNTPLQIRGKFRGRKVNIKLMTSFNVVTMEMKKSPPQKSFMIDYPTIAPNTKQAGNLLIINTNAGDFKNKVFEKNKLLEQLKSLSELALKIETSA